MNPHVDAFAELYALGELDEATRARIDAHVVHCEACARNLGEAERTAAALIVGAPVPSKRLDRRVRETFAARARRYPRISALAAALILALLPSFALLLREREAARDNAGSAQVLHALVNSHFEHAQFLALTNDAPHAKVIFARSGAWIDVLADTDRPLSVGVIRDGKTILLGTLRPSGGEGSFFMHNPPPGTLVLVEGSRILAKTRTR